MSQNFQRATARSDVPDRKDFLYLAALLAMALVLGCRGILKAGYIGQDFTSHHFLMVEYHTRYSYYYTNPPGLYWLGNLIHGINARFDYEIISFLLLVLNLAGLGIIYRLLWQSLSLRPLRYAAAALITFIPFRVIHAIVFSSDALTIPFFAGAAFFTLRLCENPRRVGSWLGLSLTLAAGMFCKYSLVAVLPAVAVVLACGMWKQLSLDEFCHWAGIGVLALALPAGVFAREMHLNKRVDGFTTNGQWLHPEDPSVMRWRDIFTLQRSDLGILSAPQYFEDKIYETRKFSYPALLHLSALTDSSNFFRPLPREMAGDRDKRHRTSFLRERPPLVHALQKWAVRWCVPLSFLAVGGILFCGLLSVQSLLSKHPSLSNATVILTTMAIATHSIILFSLPRINDPYVAGYWTPRLVMPSLLVFYALGFVLLDFACRRWSHLRAAKFIPNIVSGYTAIACLLFIGFLW